MKDLKHYFTSPGGSDNESLSGNNGIISKKRRLTSVSDNLEFSSEIQIVKKKKRKKKSNLNETVQVKYLESNPKPEKKRKKQVEEVSVKKPRVSELCENVIIIQKTEESKKNVSNKLQMSADSSKENSMNSSYEGDEKSLDISNNLHNYFNKVEKIPDFTVKPNVFKVEAVVHYPPSSELVKQPKRLKTRLRRRKSVDLRPEYDVITSEEDNSSFQNSTNEFCINVSISLDEKNHSEEILTSPESLNEACNFNDSVCHKNNDECDKSSPSEPITLPNAHILSKVKHDGTLNSFFKIPNKMINMSEPEVNEERKIARQQFLNSGVPEKIKKQLGKKQEIVFLNSAPFPKHHVTQADILNVIWNLQVIKLQFKSSKPTIISTPSWSGVTNRFLPELERKINKIESGPIQEKKIIKKLKKEITAYPIGKWYTELHKMKDANAFEMWSEKYKPKSSLHLIGNSKNIEKLKNWLLLLNKNKYNAKKGNDSYGSEDEFLKSDDETESDLKTTAFLHGPSGSGKTATVYALAEEIGFQILEINSSCNRMGKKILHEFSEALQSHKVETNVLNYCSKNNKMEKTKKTLILIKDVDIIFSDYDEGFISSIATLAASSKRPIILTLNEFHPKHLAKIIPLMHFKLDYEPLPQDLLCSWIRTVAAVEGNFLDEQDAFELVNWSKGDIRKLLLQLQFSFAKSSKVICTNYLETRNVWQNISEQRLDVLDETKNTAKLCNFLTACDIIKGVLNNKTDNDTALNLPWHSALKDSSELNQPSELVDHFTRDMLADSLEILNEKRALSQLEQRFPRYQNQSVIPIIERDVISPISVLSHSSVAIDYLPALRTIARSEIKRLEAHSKRNNRYFSYLQSIGVTDNTNKISSFLSEALNSAF